MMKKLLFLIYVIPLLVFSQNSIGVDSSISVSVNETFEIPISLNSDGDFIAFQTDISFNPSAFNYQNYNVDNTLIPNHSVTVNLIEQGVLRILVYSGSNSNFPEGNLNFLNLQFNALAEDGNFTFNFINTVSDSSEFSSEPFNIQVNLAPAAQINISGGAINQHSNLVSFVNLTNTVPLKAMQFDLIVPNNFQINENSIQETSRLENHNVSFSLVSTNTYRILIYSTNNSTIDIGSGSLFSFNYLTNEIQAGSYQPDIELTELVGENNQIVTGVFEIDPLIILENSLTASSDLNLGDINLNENIIFSVDLTNNDGVVHFINQIESAIFSSNVNLPSQIAVNETKNIVFNFTPNAVGNISEVIQFYHTGNESISEINITANVISENYFTILPQSIDNNTNSNLNIYLKNSLPVKGFQFDFSIPDGFSIDIDNIENSSLLDNFDYQISQIDNLNYRFLYYDTNSQPIQPGFESLISVPLIAENSVSSGYYSVGFSEVSIVGEQNQNISSSNNTVPQFYYSSSELQNSYLKLVDVSSERGVSKKIEIQLINEVDITGIQFDIDIPSVFNPDLSTVNVISRTTGFSYSLSHITGTQYRCLIYSTSNLVVPIGDSAILEFMIFVNDSAPLGDYEFNISDVTLVDSNNQNASTPPIEVGYFTVVENSITLLGDNPMNIEVGSTFTDPGATAVDVNGNDISSSILISGAVDVNTIGSYIITYYLTDVNGNISSSVSRTVNIIAPEIPVITLLGDNPMTIEVGTTFTDPGATASDAGDGDLTSSIVVSGSVDTSTIGTYTLTYDVSDTSGNPADSVTRTVNVVDTTVPVITLLGDTTVTIEVGATYTDSGATAADNYDGDLTSSIAIVNNVDTSTVGTYTVTYNVSDTSGNAAVPVTRTVNVVDTTAPVITLLGDNPMTIEVGTTFTDPGATASDAGDGDLTSSIVVSGSVDTSTIGTYTLTYDVSDTSGNAADSVTRTVNVVDTTAPVITLLGDNLMTIEVGTTFTDPGAVATDNYDGDLTSSIVVSGSVDTSTIGTYSLTYDVSDTSGNPADSVTRTVNVVDTTVPVITLLGDTTVTIEVGATYTDSGATAADNYDGDLTSSIAIVNNVDTSTVGTYTVTYNVSDTTGNAAVSVTRTVNVVDTTVPVITLLGDTTVTIEVGTTYTDSGATAADNYDGDLTSSIAIVNNVDTSTVGTYTVTYDVSDTSGNAAVSVTRTVNVVDTTAPVITLLGDNPMTIEVGTTFTDPGATASDAGDGDLTSSIVVSGSVDTSTIGTYTLTYDVSDTSGNPADSVTRTVNVVDTTVPVITLLGDTTVTIEVGATYTDSGATAADNYDGDLTSSIAIVNNVDTSTVGTYTVTYNVSDTSGNAAVPVTRTVNVVDTTVPVITLLGDTTVTIEVGATYTDSGATAADNYDGDLTSSIAIVNNVDTSTVGTYTVTYNVSDTTGNAAVSVTRTVNVVDTTVPVITLLGDTTVTIEVGTTYTDSGATAADNYDGDLTSSIAIVNNVDTSTVGTYTVTYNVSDTSGNAAVPVTRTVNVVDTTAPVITLLGDNPMTIEVGTTFTDPGATASDAGDGDLTSSIVVSGSVDTSTIGTYTLTYDVSDTSGNPADSVTRTVNVVDTTVPVITLLGDTTVTIEVGATYTDSGATAADNYDGDLTSSIAIVNNVDTSTVGTYTVTYNVSDTSGNAAVPVTRTVNVVDTTVPVITLLGDTTVTIEVGATYTDSGATAADNYDGDLTSSIAIVNNVDTSTVGTYTVTYNVSDTTGNAAVSVTRTVNVVDTTVPVITLLGDTTVTIEVGTTYTDSGATAADNYDGDLTSSIAIVNNVDTSTVGTYTVTYNVSDTSGNAADSVTRTVNVVDTTAPVITLLGDNPMTIEVGTTFTDPGATASDAGDGDLTSSIVVSGSVDTSTIGTYTLTYDVSDTSGNAADSVTRTVNVVDTTAPVITLLGDNLMTIEVGTTFTDPGAVATDNYDGDLTSSIAIVNNVDTSTVGTYTVTYNVSDTSGNAAVPVTRTVNVVDTTAPVITLLGDNLMTIEVGTTFTDPGAVATDNYDGDLTSSIVVSGSVDTSTIGTYTLTYDVSDTSGNPADSVTRTVNVVDTTAPVITLLGDTTVTIEVGATYTDSGATAADNYDGDLTSSIAIVNNVDTSTVGTYTVTYNVSDTSGNAAVPVTRTVNVVDTTAPVITLLGDNPMTIEVGTTFTDPGATASDAGDGDLTSSIAIVNNVDTSTVGTYTVTYNVSDTSGNAAVPVTRTVNVVDTTVPVITLLGDYYSYH